MDDISLESLLITEEEWIACEGAGTVLIHLAKSIGLAIGIPVLVVGAAFGAAIGSSVLHDRKLRKIVAARTPEQIESEKNYNETWVPEFNRFLKGVSSDLERADKKFGILSYLKAPIEIGERHASNLDTFNVKVCGIDLDKVYNGIDEDDPLPHGKAQRIYNLLQGEMKLYFERWKGQARRYAPYFEMVLDLDEPNEDYVNFGVFLQCKYTIELSSITRDAMLKAGLPPFKK